MKETLLLTEGWIGIGDLEQILVSGQMDTHTTTKNQIDTYISLTQKFVSRNLIIGAFSDNGPLKCSGLEITQYSKNKMSEAFNAGFEPIKCIRETHQTPFKTTQDFVFCSFKKR